MKRSVLLLCIFAICLTFLAGCTAGDINVETHMAYTFSVETGDTVILRLNTSDGYKMTSDLPFVISYRDDAQSQGLFITADSYYAYVDSVENDSIAEILESSENTTCEYVMWNYGDKEYNYAILIKNSQTAILLGNDVSEESARSCFERLEISLGQ